MKKILAMLLALTMVFALVACSKNDNGTTAGGNTGNGELAGTYSIKVWCPEAMEALTKTQIEEFNKNNGMGITLNATVEPVGEDKAATNMTNDVTAGADLYFFASDQLVRLIQAGALSQLGQSASAWLKENNDDFSVTTATSGEKQWAYPLTDNGYFMYYDKSVITEEDSKSLEKIIAACEKAGKNISFEAENAWYTPAFFFATGCISEWKVDENGKFVSIDDTFNSANGLLAAEGLKKLVTSSSYINSASAADFEAKTPSAVVVSGSWAYETAKKILGDNLGVAELPSFEAGGKSYHLSGFRGTKMIGVKPSSDAKRTAVLNQLAQYLTGEKCQLDRFKLAGWNVTNKKAKEDAAVKASPTAQAAEAQGKYTRPQGNINGAWWDIAKVIGTNIKSGTSLEDALKQYEDAIKETFTISDEVRNAWTVIGNINGDTWTIDLEMTKQEDGTWKTKESYELTATTEFKVRQGKSWDNNYGANGEAGGANVTIVALGIEAGTYYIVFNAETGMISAVAA